MHYQSQKIKLPYGLRKSRLFHISEVESGLKCDCICPKCKSKLIAKKGEEKSHHFAHHQEKECIGGLETAIHLMAKQTIYDNELLVTPEFTKETFLEDNRAERVYGEKVVIKPSKIKFEKVELERSHKGFRPDVVGFINGKQLFIEIKVTHEVDEQKKKHVESLNYPMIEIDLSDLKEETFNDHDKFVNEVLFEKNNKTWISNPKAEPLYQLNMSKLREKVEKINKGYEIEEREKRKVEYQRKFLRKKNSSLLKLIKDSYTDDWKKKRNQYFLKKDEHEISKIKKKIGIIGEEKASIFNENIKSGWIFETHPIVWQGAIFLRYIQSKPINSSFTPYEVVKFISKHFDIIDFVLQLRKIDNTQKKPPKKYLSKHAKEGIWFLIENENKRLIRPIDPIRNYLEYLSKIRILRPKEFKNNYFKIHLNSLTALKLHVKKQADKKERERKRIEDAGKYRAQQIMGKRKVVNHNKSRVNEIIKSEKRVFELYGTIGSQCMKCMLTSHNKDGDNCPFCGYDHFKQIHITKEHLKMAHHKYLCNSSITDARKVPIDRTLLNEFDSKIN